MDNNNDFTFCQVAPPLDQDDPEGKELVRDIGGNFINESLNKSGGNQKKSGFLWNDKLQDNVPSIKQETVGSLSFSVTDASTAKNLGNFSREVTSMEAGTSQQLKPGGRKLVARAKVPFEKGYSQMDWLKLTRTHPDLAGLKGQSNRRLISKSEVKQHQTEGSMWTVLKGHVYNIYPYMKFHPGGVDMLMKAVGKDCTSLFNKYHAWVNADFLLEKCLVGILDDSQEGQPAP